MSSSIICDGLVTQSGAGAAQCATGWSVVEYALPFQITDVDPVVFAAYVGAGFFILLPLYAAVIGCRVLIKSIN